MAKKILYLQATFDLDLPRNIRTANIIDHLKKDYDIEVLCFTSTAMPRSIEGITIHRLTYTFLSKYIFNKTYSGYQPKGIFRFFSRAISFLFGRFLFPDVWVLEEKNILNFIQAQPTTYDAIVVSIIPFSLGKIALTIKKASPNTKIILDIGDPLSNNAGSSDHNLTQKIAYEKILLREADKIVVTNQLTKDYYLSISDIAQDKIAIITQGVNTTLFPPSEKTTFDFSTLKIIYAGIFYANLRDPYPFFQALEMLNSTNFEVNIYGEINRFGIDEAKTRSHFFGRVSQEDLATRYKNHNMILYIDNAYGIQTSGKIYELLMLQIPILMLYTNEKSPVLDIVSSFSHVFLVKNEKNQIAEALIKLNKINAFQTTQNETTRLFSWGQKATEFRLLLKQLLEIW